MSISPARPLPAEPPPARPAPQRPADAPPRESFTLPEQAQDAPGMEHRREPARARPDGERTSGTQQSAEPKLATAAAAKKTTATEANPAKAADGADQTSVETAAEAAVPVDSAFTAQIAAAEAAAAMVLKTDNRTDPEAEAEAETETAALQQAAAPATAAPLAAAAVVQATTTAASASPASEEQLAVDAVTADGAEKTAKSDTADASAADTADTGDSDPAQPAASTTAKPKAKAGDQPAATAAAPDAAPTTEAPKAAVSKETKPAEDAPLASAPDHPKADKGNTTHTEAKTAVAETVAKLEQALQPLATPQRPVEQAPLAAEKPQQLPEQTKPLPPAAVPVEIGLRALQGLKEFQIRLDPAELGRVDVRLEISDDKSVSAKVVVDRVETLHLLQRDAKTLERAFEQAGLKSTDAGIDISLRDPGQQQRNGRGEAWDGDGQFGNRRARAEEQPAIQPIIARRTLHVGALDLSI